MTITGVVIGIIIITLGIVGLKNNFDLTNSFGSSGFLTRYLGGGNEYALFKLLCVLLILVGIITFFGLFDDIMNFVLAPLRNLINRGG